MSNYDPAANGGYNYGAPQNTNWGQRPYYGYQPAQPQPRLITNKSYVTSLEEALLKTTERNSDMIHFHQDKNEFYCVKVDMEGKKSWAVFTYNVPNPDENVPATRADILALVARIEALESAKPAKVAPKQKKEAQKDGELDG